MRVNIKNFLNKYRTSEYRHGIYIPEDIYIKCSQMELGMIAKGVDVAYIDLPDDIYDIIESNKKDQEYREDIDNRISNHRICGINYEKEGNIEDAISEYKKAIEIGEQTSLSRFTSYAYAYERIIILLHKIKDIENEKHYIQAYLLHNDIAEKTKEKYINRLNKMI